MSDNIRTALYDAVYDCRLVSRVVARSTARASAALSRVVGKHCESGDIVVRDCWLPADLAPGDLLAVAATGAYCYSMASSYNRLPRPAVVAVRDGAARVLLRRETVDDQFRLEVTVSPGEQRTATCGDPRRDAAAAAPSAARSCGCCASRPTSWPPGSARRVELVGVAVRRPHRHPELGDLLTTDASGAGHARRRGRRRRGDRRHRARPHAAAGGAEGRQVGRHGEQGAARRGRRGAGRGGRRVRRRPLLRGVGGRARSRCCGRCASRWRATGSPAWPGSSTAPRTSSSPR